MINRRAYYRQPFPGSDKPRVTLTSPDQPAKAYEGEVLNLSVGGMGLRLPPTNPGPQTGAVVSAQLSLPRQKDPLVCRCLVIHTLNQGGALYSGFQFMPLDNPHAEDRRDRTIWLYLLDEQRRERQKQREQTQSA